jgi:hypothetical protein
MPYILRGAYDNVRGKQASFEYREADARTALKGCIDLHRDGVHQIGIIATDGNQITEQELTERAISEGE